MRIPTEIVWRDFSPTDAIRADIAHQVERLEKVCADIVACRVAIEMPHKRHNQGKLFHVRVDVTVPGAEIVANRDPSNNHAHEDFHVALRDAFNATRRQLTSHMERKRDRDRDSYKSS